MTGSLALPHVPLGDLDELKHLGAVDDAALGQKLDQAREHVQRYFRKFVAIFDFAHLFASKFTGRSARWKIRWGFLDPENLTISSSQAAVILPGCLFLAGRCSVCRSRALGRAVRSIPARPFSYSRKRSLTAKAKCNGRGAPRPAYLRFGCASLLSRQDDLPSSRVHQRASDHGTTRRTYGFSARATS
jgi:hypothetical protein